MSSLSPAGTNWLSWCSASCLIERVFGMLSWRLRLTGRRPIISASGRRPRRATCRRPMPVGTTTSSRFSCFSNDWSIISKKNLGRNRERRQNSDLLSDNGILHDGRRPEETGHSAVRYEMLQIASISHTDTTDLKTLFSKSNYNTVNELNDSNGPTLF